MKKITFISVSILVLMTISITVFYSCKKEHISEKLTNPISALRLETNNPYDWVGKLHNEGLDYALENKAEIDTTSYSSINADVEFLVTSFIINKISEDSVENFNEIDLRTNIDEFFEIIEEIDIRDSLSSTQLTFIYNAKNNIDSSNVWTLDNVLDGIVHVEDAILNSNLSDQEKCMPLIYCAILRNSAIYWQDENNYDDWDVDPSMHWGIIAAEDAVGALHGGITGGISSFTSGALMFGPGGAVLSVMGGAVVGALQASIIGGLGNFLWDIWP